MHKKLARNRLIIFFATLAFIVTGTYVMIRYAQGYRPTKTGIIKGTGLLSANSYPTGAEVYINDRLTTATDATLNLDPGNYIVTIKKDGYHAWSKNLAITEELVTQTNTQLFPSSPSLEPLTYTGATNPVPSPNGDRLLFVVDSASTSTKNGLYIQDLNTSSISPTRSTRQIAESNSNHNYSESIYTFSPTGTEILVSFKNGSHIILQANKFNEESEIKDITVKLSQTLSEWEAELSRDERIRLLTLPDFMIKVATESATNIYFSPDGEKLLYQSISNLSIPENLIPQLPASSTQTQSREIVAGSWYVYDMREDRNFKIADTKIEKEKQESFVPEKKPLLKNLDPIPVELVASLSAFRKLQGSSPTESISLFNAQYSPIFAGKIQWYPNSDHLILTTESGIDILDYDGTNRVTLYDGPMDPNFVYPWPDGSRLIARIQFSPDTVPNLYTIKIK